MIKCIIYSFCVVSISFSQLIPGRISLAGNGYYQDLSDKDDYDHYERIEFTAAASYNFNQSISIDTKFNFYRRDSAGLFVSQTVLEYKTVYIGFSRFLKNNVFFSFLVGSESASEGNYHYANENQEEILTVGLGYRADLTSSISVDVGYFLGSRENSEGQFEFLIRMFI